MEASVHPEGDTILGGGGMTEGHVWILKPSILYIRLPVMECIVEYSAINMENRQNVAGLTARWN